MANKESVIVHCLCLLFVGKEYLHCITRISKYVRRLLCKEKQIDYRKRTLLSVRFYKPAYDRSTDL